MVHRLSLKIFYRNLVKNLSIMASRRNEYSLHNYACFVLIPDSHVHINCFVKGLLLLKLDINILSILHYLGSPLGFCTLIFDLMRNLYIYNACIYIHSIALL